MEDIGSILKFTNYANTGSKELIYDSAYSIGIKSGEGFCFIAANENLDYAAAETMSERRIGENGSLRGS